MSLAPSPMIRSRVSSFVKRTMLALALSSGAWTAEADGVEGIWWLDLDGRDRGAARLQLDADARTGELGFGFSRALGGFFEIAAGQALELDSAGGVSGVLLLSDPGSKGTLGELSIQRGGATKNGALLKLKGKIRPAGGGSREVSLKGRRLDPSFPVVTGEAADGRMSGKGIKQGELSSLRVDADPELGVPAYTIEGVGEATIASIPGSDLSIAGRMVLSPDGHVFGSADASSTTGAGEISGSLRVREYGAVPKLRLTIRGDRKASVRAVLATPIVPALTVYPQSFDFGRLALDGASKTQTFLVSNAGSGVVSGVAFGIASLENGDFTIVGPSTFGPLSAGDPAIPITVQFDPSVSGAQQGVLDLRGIGALAGAQASLVGASHGPLLVIEGSDSQGTLPACPAPDRIAEFSVSNIGELAYEGTAEITEPFGGLGRIAFAWDSGGDPIRSLPVSLAVSESTSVTVRFGCAATETRAFGVLTLVGEGGARKLLGQPPVCPPTRCMP